jgi:N4-gp56 family major capsid protein
LKIARANFVYKQAGKMGTIPASEGKTVVWNRFTDFAAQTTALTEGTDPTAIGMSATLVSATISQYGALVTVSDLVNLVAIDNMVSQAIDQLAYNAALTIDTNIRDIVVAGTNVLYASGVANRTSLIPTNVITVADVRKAVRSLKQNNAAPMANGDYMAVIHPDVEYDLQGDSNWVNAHQYTDAALNGVYNGEVGKLYGVRFMNTTQAPKLVNSGSAGTEVYQSMFFGNESFGVSELQSLKTYVDSPSPRSALRLYSDVSWKASFAAKILNDNFLVRLESSATA